MPKRNSEEKINHYISKIEKLRAKKRRRRIVFSSSSDSEENIEIGAKTIDESNALQPIPHTCQLPSTVNCDIINEDSTEKPAIDLDPQLLEALGDTADETPVYGPAIHDKLAHLWPRILKKGLEADGKAKLLKDYAIPDNCKLLKSPTLNAEISAAIADTVRNRDKKLQAKQDQLAAGITAINKAMSLLLTSEDKVQAIKILSDSCRLLTDLHFTETQVRTKLITPGLDKSFLTVIQDQERDETLFGSELPDKIKASKAIEKQVLQIKKINPKPSSSRSTTSAPRFVNQGNWSAPPRFPPPRRGGRIPSYRTHAQHPYRRPAPAPPQTSRSTTAPTSNKRAPARQ